MKFSGSQIAANDVIKEFNRQYRTKKWPEKRGVIRWFEEKERSLEQSGLNSFLPMNFIRKSILKLNHKDMVTLFKYLVDNWEHGKLFYISVCNRWFLEQLTDERYSMLLTEESLTYEA